MLCLPVPGLQHQRVRPGGMAVLPCGQLKAGRVTWSRDLHGRQVSILSTDNGDVTRHLQNHNHSSLPDLSLLIWFVSSWDQGLYYCNGTPVACLTVKAGKNPTINTYIYRCSKHAFIKLTSVSSACYSSDAFFSSLILSSVLLLDVIFTYWMFIVKCP